MKEGVYKDKLRFYYFTKMADGGQLTMVAACSFVPLKKGFFQGSDGLLYIKTQQLIKPPEAYSEYFYRQVPDIDVASYKGEATEGYGTDNNHVYYRKNTTEGTNIHLLEGADRKSFQVINPYNLAKDKKQVYYYDRPVIGLNPVLINSQKDFDNYLLTNEKSPGKN